MPSVDIESKATTGPSWADQVDQVEDDELPAPVEAHNKNQKVITEYKYNDEKKKVKVVKTYKIETKRVPKCIARRKTWKKFGESVDDPLGPNPANTIPSEEVYMQFVHDKQQQPEEQVADDPISKLKGRLVSCRICKGDHWTTKCPYKDTLSPLQEALDGADKAKTGEGEGGEGPAPGGPAAARAAGGKYVPPSMREGAVRRGESMHSQKRDESATIRVTNLSEDTRESDLQELFRPFGTISRIYLAKDKVTGQSKGFAFINFHRREDAKRAIDGVSGFGYDHLILNVEWAKPSGTS